ncbi:MBL fold metallo-hydrolase [Salmonella enterica]|nr:MBL fold metallo-hydrolase [Salmonella enterica]
MKLTQIRNATLKLEFAGIRFLIDPMLSNKETWPGFSGSARNHLRNPTVDLPLPVEELLDVDAIIVTHTHRDHWDEAAQQLIPKNSLIYTQNNKDEALLRSQGFTAVRSLTGTDNIFGVTVFKTDCQHGSDEAYSIPEVAERLGQASGLVFSHKDEKTMYIAGDTIWSAPYVNSLMHYKPDVVVLNMGYAVINDIGAIIMGKEDAMRTHEILPSASIIASHMEAVNHCLLSRAELHEYTVDKGLERQVFIPQDGESLHF